MGPIAPNIKTRPDALGTAENVSVRANHENYIHHTLYRQKQVRERKTLKTGPDAIGTDVMHIYTYFGPELYLKLPISCLISLHFAYLYFIFDYTLFVVHFRKFEPEY
jgi:hypothetical protein